MTGKWWEKEHKLDNFVSLKNSTTIEADLLLVNQEISAVGNSIKMYEGFVENLPVRTVKKREEYQNSILELKKKISFLKKIKIKVEQSATFRQ